MSHDERILKLLDGLSANVATILHEQQSQRIDIRSLQRDVSDIKGKMSDMKGEMLDIKGEVSDVKDEMSNMTGDMSNMKDEILDIKATMVTKDDLAGSEARLKVDINDLRTEVTQALKTHEERLREIEKLVGITDPTKH